MTMMPIIINFWVCQNGHLCSLYGERALLIEDLKYVREPDPKFLNMLFTLNNKPYDTRNGALLIQSRVKTTKHVIK